MRLILIGPPGSGKGTQAKRLGQRLGLVHYAMGDILRDAVRLKTAEGKQAAAYMAQGQLVPDDIVNHIVFSRFAGPDRPTRFVMDGYPRNISQAQAFDRMLQRHGLDLTAVIFLNVPDQEIISRISARWNCPNPKCQATYNTLSKPPKSDMVCDECGTPLVQREDDKAETVSERLAVFHRLTDDLLDYYRKQELVVEVPGVGDIETIYQNILAALKRSP
jgi:adenylate kinase